MSEREILEGKTVITSAGMLFYRRNRGEIEVLTAIRQNEPWKRYNAIVFGGLVQKSDKNTGWAALREGHEETGGTLRCSGALRLVGIYGPQNYFHEIRRNGSELIAITTSTPISDKHFVMIVYADEVLSGVPTENPEMHNLRFIKPLVLADEGLRLAFEDALILADFWHKIRYHPSWMDPKIVSLIATPRD